MHASNIKVGGIYRWCPPDGKPEFCLPTQCINGRFEVLAPPSKNGSIPTVQVKFLEGFNDDIRASGWNVPLSSVFPEHFFTPTNKPAMKKFSYFLHRDGCTLYFAVLEQPENWRASEYEHLKWEGSEGVVASYGHPEIIGNTIYLRGVSTEKDLLVDVQEYGEEINAITAEHLVQKTLKEFVEAGGFGHEFKPKANNSSVTTFII